MANQKRQTKWVAGKGVWGEWLVAKVEIVETANQIRVVSKPDGAEYFAVGGTIFRRESEAKRFHNTKAEAMRDAIELLKSQRTTLTNDLADVENQIAKFRNQIKAEGSK